MSLEDFLKIDKETTYDSILKGIYLKIHHQQAANLNDSDQNIEVVFAENNNYQQIGNDLFQ